VGVCVECGLQQKIRARRLCDRCYQRIRWHGRLEEFPTTTTTAAEWYAQIDKSDPAACWPWPGPISVRGYGNTGMLSAHRWAWRHVYGTLPKLDLDHTCHGADSTCTPGPTCPHRACVNVAHLEPVSRGENVKRGGLRLTHCKRGHAYEIGEDGRRRCPPCRKASKRKSYERERARGAVTTPSGTYASPPA
jgi:hypothetical protein